MIFAAAFMKVAGAPAYGFRLCYASRHALFRHADAIFCFDAAAAMPDTFSMMFRYCHAAAADSRLMPRPLRLFS